MPDLNPGDKAPDFDLATDGGGRAKLADFAGSWLVLYSYPKDDTPGCTTEAIAFTDTGAEFAAAGAKVVGVSKDSPKSHDRFKAKHNLGFTLASDPDGEMLERYGLWVEKSLYGRKYMGIDRATFLIGPDGLIRAVWRKVKVAGHAQAVLEALRTSAG
ncbi:MAG: peroxiredoxin [Caulobacteraceae bacterium]